MKLNLTSQIKLVYIPERYFKPKDDVELAALTQKEKIFTRIFETPSENYDYIAGKIVKYINNDLKEKGRCNIAFGTGANLIPLYAKLVGAYQEGKVDFENVSYYSMSEFINPGEKGPSSMKFLKEAFLNKVNIKPENIHNFSQDLSRDNMYHRIKAYEKDVEENGGLDVIVCEVDRNGGLVFNEPGTPETKSSRLVLLNNEQRQKLSNEYKEESFPSTVVTMGPANIMAGKRVIAFANGEPMSETIRKVVEEDVCVTIPASVLQLHSHAKIVVDLEAAGNLTRLSHPWQVVSCEWTDRLIRSAIIWLCNKTGKPILKLTDTDYNEGALGELLALYGSAYNVNLKVFKELRETITGWPGGKPGEDDSHRPERALPFPKTVLIFSPHPDDDVISMGGTLKRLTDQNHNVHVAYETSGNIAVGDEDMMRYIDLMNSVSQRFGFSSSEYARNINEILDFINNKKNSDVIDLEEIRFLKTKIRQVEARQACKFVGVKPENIHFLNLPFYETGTIKKNDLTEKDIKLVRDLISELKPHQIFVAGDLADPHGTHRICTDAVFAVLDEFKEQEWMKDCKIWMYRGAWAEWDLNNIEMAVPLSPEELFLKRKAILKHQSQMENAPFLGDDQRLFWQRAEDRNRGTALLYHRLGLPSYEAIEAFVEYHP